MIYYANRNWPEYNGQLEGFIKKLSAYEPGLEAADFTTLHRRISRRSLAIQNPESDVVVAVDSTGIKVTNRGGWIVESKQLLSLEIAEEDTADSEVLRPLLKDVNRFPEGKGR